MSSSIEHKLQALKQSLEGEFFFDKTHRISYATDASAYREVPLGVAFPRNESDLKSLIAFAEENDISLIPRTAGTSLAGQVVGKGIVVDVSKHFNKILEVNAREAWAWVEPGVIRDELNMHLKPYGLFFAPETSTANRAMIGGMVGNNSCGSNSVKYGSTREHLLALKVVLADGNSCEFRELNKKEFEEKLSGKNCVSELEQSIYQKTFELLNTTENQVQILENYPHPEIPRRNTGYALDMLLRNELFDASSSQKFNFCTLLAGSEGTLAFTTAIKVKLSPLPPKHQALVCAHFADLYESLEATQLSLKYNPYSVELIDNYILECTEKSKEHQQNRFFVEGKPKALLVIQLFDDSSESLLEKAEKLIEKLKSEGYGYHFPVLTESDCTKVWNLRKAGLGLLSNIPGDAKPVPVVEDTAVRVADLPNYIREFNQIMSKHNLSCVHYAHAGSGEIHLRPILNLKTNEGNALFKTVLNEVSQLVKKYKGSLSGEHGDGRLRGEFIQEMIGSHCYALLEETKQIWDSKGIFNRNKIVHTPSMNSHLRYFPNQQTPELETIFRFDDFDGYVRTAELCNGSADCRKTELTGGTMCPTYMATRNEVMSTRARANLIRESFRENNSANFFNDKDVKDILSHCIACKGCKSECPSSVDMTKLKTEYEYQFSKKNRMSWRNKLIAHSTQIQKQFQSFAGIYNSVNQIPFIESTLKSILGFSQKKSLPKIASLSSVKKVYNYKQIVDNKKGSVVLFFDEFTHVFEPELALLAVKVLNKLGYKVEITKNLDSGRAFFSKGELETAKKMANKNVRSLSKSVQQATALVGIEPSALLSFKDEYPQIVDAELIEKANILSEKSFLLDDFIAQLIDEGEIDESIFTLNPKEILIHGHCHQKAITGMTSMRKTLNFPKNYSARLIPSGCCGMAGSFGYETKNEELSNKIGELVLFPTIRETNEEVLIVASGFSCRHQIIHGTQRKALHYIKAIWEALK